ncbi:MAG: hypothetical protein IRZ08_01005 [Frankia sp.]|nr:hypothetical protein [Frankia sp.]
MRDREDIDWGRWLERWPAPTSEEEVRRALARAQADQAWLRKAARTAEIRCVDLSLTLAGPGDGPGEADGWLRLRLHA